MRNKIHVAIAGSLLTLSSFSGIADTLPVSDQVGNDSDNDLS